MALHFAKSTGGFYDSATGAALPADAVAITPERHQALLQAQAAGRVITADASGAPLASAGLPPPLAAQAAAALAASDATMLRLIEAVALGETSWTAAPVAAFARWRRGLRAIAAGARDEATLPPRPADPAGG